MSLTTFIAETDVKETLRIIQPNISRKIACPVRCEPKSKRYSLVGIAFDYLLRFEIQKYSSNTITFPWIAECSLNAIRWLDDKGEIKGYFFLSLQPNGTIKRCATEPGLHEDEFTIETINRMTNIIHMAKDALQKYIQNKHSDVSERYAMAKYAICLGKMDSYLRCGIMDASFTEVAEEDIQDLLGMLEIVPFNQIITDTRIWLNPNFGDTSVLFKGADADLIIGDQLIDIKVTKSDLFKPEFLDQLLGYFLIARNEKKVNKEIPIINKVGIYFARQGYLWSMDTNTWVNHKSFPGTEEWFFKRVNNQTK